MLFSPLFPLHALNKLQIISSFLLKCCLKLQEQQQERKLAIFMAAAGQGLWKHIANVGSNKVNSSYLGCRKLNDHSIAANYKEFSVSHFSCPVDIWIFASHIIVEQELLRKAKGPLLCSQEKKERLERGCTAACNTSYSVVQRCNGTHRVRNVIPLYCSLKQPCLFLKPWNSCRGSNPRGKKSDCFK